MKTKEAGFAVALALMMVGVLLLVSLPIGSPSVGSSGIERFVTSAQATDAQGLTLEVSDNAAGGIQPNQSITFSIALYNKNPNALNASGEDFAAYASSGQLTWHFPFLGFPLAPDPWCNWNEPYEFVVLKGFYNDSSVQGLLYSGTPVHILCMENGAALWYLFPPQSDNATMKVPACAICNDNYTLSQSFSSNASVRVAGYWDPSHLPNGGPILYIGAPTQWDPGANYTIAVGDAWGGLVTLSFFVATGPSGSPAVASPIVCLFPGPNEDCT